MNTHKTDTEDWKEIVIRLRDIAEEKGITQEEIAEKSGLIQSNVSRIFTLRFVPKISTLALIAKALNVEIIIKR